MRSRRHGPCIPISAACILLVACACGQSSGDPSPPPPTGDGHGPAVACTSPAHGAILSQAPGEITLSGTVTDVDGVAALTVNGAPVAVGASGSFSVPLDAAWGINLVTLSAADRFGAERRATCAFLLSEAWAPEDALLSGTLVAAAERPAIDDANRADPIDSLTDVLHAVLNSAGMRTAIHGALLAANPIKPSSCDQFVINFCVLRTQVRYENLEIQGPNTASLVLVEGGLRSTATASNVRLRLRVDGQAAGIPFDTTGWVSFSTASVEMTLDTALSGSRPRALLRPGSVLTSVGTIATEFSGLDGSVMDIVVSLANASLRSIVANLVRDYVSSTFTSILDGILGSLDVHGPSAFEVPRLDGTGPLSIGSTTAYSGLDATAERMLLTLGTRFVVATPAHARPTLGAPIPAGTGGLEPDPSPPSSFAGAVHVGMLGQVLHALWRGGYFDATFGEGALGGLLGPGVTLAVATGLPPAVRLVAGDRVEIGLGAVSVRVTDPSIATAPVDLVAGGKASCAVSVAADRLELGGCTVGELAVSPAGAVLGSGAQATVVALLTALLEQGAAAAGSALPALPVPGFVLPPSVAPFGLPAGEELGILAPSLGTSGDHLVLTGAFGIR